MSPRPDFCVLELIFASPPMPSLCRHRSSIAHEKRKNLIEIKKFSVFNLRDAVAAGDRMTTELIESSAVDLVGRLRSSRISPLDLLDAVERRISEVEPSVNALPTLCFDRAREHAKRLMAVPASQRGVLCGLPIPIKDTLSVNGVRTTFGSPIYRDSVPTVSDVLVRGLEGEGAVIYARSNTPEFAAGANTFNEVFGATRNPYDLTKSAGGSSGGAAAALASGTAWVAHGSDMGGSLRTPASFCGVVGLRPTPGRIAQSRRLRVDGTLSTQGPMARTVEDVALLLDAMCGDDPIDPLSKPRPIKSWLESARDRRKPRKVAYSSNLGITPVDPEVERICRQAVQKFEGRHIPVENAEPNLQDVAKTFQILRAYGFAISYGDHLRDNRAMLKPEMVWNIEKGFSLGVNELVAAEIARAKIATAIASFFSEYDLLVCPTAIVAPFPVTERHVTSCNGTQFETYIDWLTISFPATLAGCPALSLPVGKTQSGLPVGIQLIAPANGEAGLLSAALILEETLEFNSLKTKRPDPT